MNPQPNMEELARYYPPDYPPYMADYRSMSDGPVIQAARKIKSGLKGLLGKKPSSRREPAEAVATDMSEKTVLDFGCGSGRMLRSLRRQHPRWKLVGFDISANPITETIEGDIVLHKGSIERLKAAFPAGSFDRIYMDNVLEHLDAPKETLAILAGLMKREGDMIIEVPNVDSIKRKVFGTNFSSLDIPRHLHHFNQQTLDRMCRRVGLAVQQVEFRGNSKGTVRSLYYALGIRSRTMNPFLISLFNTVTHVVGKERIDDDGIRIRATKTR
jgi:2-polyprenyl-3-methyl-5-hydroxy-6-metoxy-1,4-benzoquinol methylase